MVWLLFFSYNTLGKGINPLFPQVWVKWYDYYSFVIIHLRKVSSSSSCRAGSTDIPDPLSSLLPIVHRSRQVLRTTPRILTQLLNVCSCWSSCFCTAMCGGPWEYISYDFIPASPAVSCMSGSSNLNSFVIGGRWPYSWCLVGCCHQDACNLEQVLERKV